MPSSDVVECTWQLIELLPAWRRYGHTVVPSRVLEIEHVGVACRLTGMQFPGSVARVMEEVLIDVGRNDGMCHGEEVRIDHLDSEA